MSQPRTIEVRANLSLAELYRGTLSVLGIFEIKRAVLFLISVVFLGAMIWKLLSASENEVLAELSPFIGWVLFPVVAYAATFGAPYVAMRMQVRKNPKILHPSEYLFSDQGVEIVGRFGRSELLWTAFGRIRETKEFFLLYVLSRQAYPLPKRCFSSKAEIAEFKEMLRRAYQGELDLHSAP
jgi:hypothetical protein